MALRPVKGRGEQRAASPDRHFVIAVSAVICDADGWEEFKRFAQAKKKSFATLLDLKHGVPSADTFRRVLSTLDPGTFGFIATGIRGPGGIENSLHHVVDVSFREDDSPIRDHATENVSRLHRIALNLLQDTGARLAPDVSIRGRRKVASRDHDFLLGLITAGRMS